MKVRKIGSNMTELEVGNITIMFSYSTPVAGQDDEGLFRTAQSYSRTTSGHIRVYLEGRDAGRMPIRTVPQAYIDSLVGG